MLYIGLLIYIAVSFDVHRCHSTCCILLLQWQKCCWSNATYHVYAMRKVST